MKRITGHVTSFMGRNKEPGRYTTTRIRSGSGARVRTFGELIERIAQLSFDNPQYVLFYRGQEHDYKHSDGRSTLLPSLFRGGEEHGGAVYERIRERFDALSRAERRLMERHWDPGRRQVRTHKILRWALLQHYEVCPTPLLDVTQTLRVACSFGPHWSSSGGGYLYVLALPQISGSVTASSAYEVQVIRLLSVCPPQALRPHYQDGYLLGEFPTIGKREKLEYNLEEMDFARRLLCKFRLPDSEDFWKGDLGPLPNKFLFPNETDSVYGQLKEARSWLERFDNADIDVLGMSEDTTSRLRACGVDTVGDLDQVASHGFTGLGEAKVRRVWQAFEDLRERVWTELEQERSGPGRAGAS